MVQRRDHLCFTLEAIGDLGIRRHVWQERLDRDAPFERRVESEVDGCHSAAADLPVYRNVTCEQRSNLSRELLVVVVEMLLCRGAAARAERRHRGNHGPTEAALPLERL